MLSRHKIGRFFVCALVPFAVGGDAPAQQIQVQTDSKPAAQPSAVVPTEPATEKSFPLIVRIDKSALIEVTQRNVDRARPVDQVVLGTHAVGQARTTGTIDAVLVPDSLDASFDLRFAGRNASRSVGTNGPAVIHSRSFTDFTCKQRVEFDPRKGFVAVGEPQIEVDTQLKYDGFGANRRLGRRVIALLAERKAGRSSAQARQIVMGLNRKELEKSFAEAVTKQVAAANDRTDVVRYVNRFLGETTKLQLTAKSAEDCIHIGIGPAEEKYAPITAMPERDQQPAQIEVWVHSSMFGKPVATILALADPKLSLPQLMQSQILEALSLATPETGTPWGVGRTGTWLIFGVSEDKPAAETVSAEVASKP